MTFETQLSTRAHTHRKILLNLKSLSAVKWSWWPCIIFDRKRTLDSAVSYCHWLTQVLILTLVEVDSIPMSPGKTTDLSQQILTFAKKIQQITHYGLRTTPLRFATTVGSMKSHCPRCKHEKSPFVGWCVECGVRGLSLLKLKVYNNTPSQQHEAATESHTVSCWCAPVKLQHAANTENSAYSVVQIAANRDYFVKLFLLKDPFSIQI